MQLKVSIDEIQPRTTLSDNVDLFEIEWFEIQKHLFNRASVCGVEIELRKQDKTEWQHADALYSKGKLIAQIAIKPAMAIVFSTKSNSEILDFIYYIANRHLPVFIEEQNHNCFVPYDGNLYEQLAAKFNSNITLEKKELFSHKLLKKKKSNH